MLLGVSRTTAYESVRRGEIPAVRLGSRLVVPKIAVAAMLGVELAELERPTDGRRRGRQSPRSGASRQDALWAQDGTGSVA